MTATVTSTSKLATEQTLSDIEILTTQIQSLQNEMKNLTDTITVLLAAILEKMPRVTGNDQMTVSIEGGSVGISASQTLATVTTVGTVTTQTQLGGRAAAQVADSMTMAGTAHIYNAITVSA